jgi:hypothetical protein
MTAQRTTVAWMLAGAALLRLGLGLLVAIAAIALRLDILTPRYFLLLAHVIVFGGVGVVLLRGTRRDGRAALLGTLLLLVAAPFADRLLGAFRGTESLALACVRFVYAFQLDGFVPWAAWAFAAEFPAAPDGPRTTARFHLICRVSATVGVALLLVNLGWHLTQWLPTNSGVALALYPLSRYNEDGFYFAIVLALSLPALPVIFLRARRAPIEDRRRVSMLAMGLVGGMAPTVLYLVALSLSGAVQRVLPLSVAGWIVYPTLLSTPLACAYAVLVQRALGAALVLRKALQYAFARYTVVSAAALPVVWLLVELYWRRTESVLAVAHASPVLAAIGCSTIGALAVSGRRGALEVLERRFFREHYDAQRILAGLIERTRWAGTRGELDHVLRTEIDRAIHPDTLDILLLDDHGSSFASKAGRTRPLDAGSALVNLAARSDDLLELEPDDASGLLRGVTDADRLWLIDGGVRLLIPLRDADDRVVGLIALGEKLSDTPYTSDDKVLLARVAAAAEMTIAYHRLRVPSASPSAISSSTMPEPVAEECTHCVAVWPAGRAQCGRCGHPTRSGALPLVVAGKFRLDERLGAGGMGVVYRATDLELGRVVAVKTLPYLSPERSARLRREARAMARVAHPHLAQIYGGETWQGRPMLIVEFLGGGTLAARLKSGPLSLGEAFMLGEALLEALAAIHDAGVLHRDVKPSNIGYTSEGVPKLLDFGTARVLASGQSDASRPIARTDDTLAAGTIITDCTRDGVIGTPLYMSPEALAGAAPDPSFDLWSTCLVLYESITGRHPLRAPDGAPRRNASVPDIRAFVPSLPATMSAFFAAALSPSRANRPRTASALIDELRTLRVGLVPDVARSATDGTVWPLHVVRSARRWRS